MVDFAFSGEDCAAHKPAPDIYLKALKALGLTADKAIAVEDSPTGIASAKAAGLKVLALKTPPRRAAGPVRRRLHHHPADGCKGASGLRWKRSRTVCAKNLTPAQLWSGARLFSAAESESDHLRSGTEPFYCAPNHFVFGGTIGLSIVLATCFPALSVSTLYVDHQCSVGCTGLRLSGHKVPWVGHCTPSFMLSFLFQYVRKDVSRVAAI